MKTLFGKQVFSVGGAQYYWEDVVLAAMAWGDWAFLKEEVRKGLACAKRMRERAEAPINEEIDSAMRDFRYERGLISADETEAWLKRWGLSNLDWLKYICMSLLKSRWADKLEDILSNFPVTDEEISRNIKIEGVCSGQLVSFCRKFAAQASMYERQTKEASMGKFKRTGKNELKELLNTYKANIKENGLPGFSHENSRKKLEALAHMDIYFKQFCKQAFNPEAINEQIKLHHTDWIRIDCLRISFAEEEIAREVALCVNEDGEQLSDVAARLNRQVKEESYYLDWLDSSLHSFFLGTRRGKLIGPLDLTGNPSLLLLCDKVMPSVDDPYIRQKAQSSILRNTIEHEIHNRVQWEPRFYKE